MKDADVNTLTINVRKLEGATALSVDGNLFERESEQVLQWVERHVNDMKTSGGHWGEPRHQHDAILITGPRGSGKSTFMLTLHKRIENRKTLKDNVAQLGMLDPSLIDGDDIFLATIVARIFGHLKDAKKEEDKGVVDALKRLAPAMLALDGTASRKKLGEVASSPALFGEKLLHIALSGLDVQARFSDFARAATAALGVKFFVLYLDDVDTAFRQGYQVLETVRRYCVDGHILPVLTGDEKLFRLVVREQVWSDLKELRNAEREPTMKREIDNQVNELEGQYLLKLLRPERRLSLPSAKDRLAEFVEVKLQDEQQNVHQTLEGLLIKANQLLFRVPDKATPDKRTSARLPFPAGELLIPNMRQIRAVIAWLWTMPEALSAVDSDAESKIRSFILSMLELHPQIRDTNLTPVILDEILKSGNYQPLSVWVCGNLAAYPRLYTMDPHNFGHEARDEPWRIAVLIVHAALSQRWRRYPGEQFAYMGAVLVPALAINDVPRAGQDPSVGEDRQAIPASWLLNGASQEPWEISARVTASLVRNWQKSKEPYYLRLRINSIDPDGRNRVEEQFAARLSGKTGIKSSRPELEQLRKGSYYSGAGPWIYDGPPRHSDDIEIIPSVAGWRQRVNKSVEYLLHWYTIPLQYYSSVLYAVDPLVGILGATALLDYDVQADKNKILNSLWRAADRDPFRIPLFHGASGSTSTEPDSADHNNTDHDTDSNRLPEAVPTEFVKYLLLPTKNWAQWFHEKIGHQGSVGPRVLSDCLVRFRSSQISIFTHVEREYWTIGWMLQSWALAMINAALVAEGRALQYRDLSEQPLSSTDLRWMHDNELRAKRTAEQLLENPRAQQNILISNLRLLEFLYNDRSSELGKPTLYWVLSTCPLIGGLLSEEWATILDYFNAKIHGDDIPKTPRIESYYLAGKKRGGKTKESDEKTTPNFSAFSLLCGLMTPEFPVPTKSRKTGGTLSSSRSNNPLVIGITQYLSNEHQQAEESSSSSAPNPSTSEASPPLDQLSLPADPPAES